LKIQIDTGSNNNYILQGFVKNLVENKSPFYAISVGGNIRITSHQTANIFLTLTQQLNSFYYLHLKHVTYDLTIQRNRTPVGGKVDQPAVDS